MQFENIISLEIIVTILAILGAVWRMESKSDRRFAELRADQKGLEDRLRAEQKGLEDRLRADQKGLEDRSGKALP